MSQVSGQCPSRCDAPHGVPSAALDPGRSGNGDRRLDQSGVEAERRFGGGVVGPLGDVQADGSQELGWGWGWEVSVLGTRSKGIRGE